LLTFDKSYRSLNCSALLLKAYLLSALPPSSIEQSTARVAVPFNVEPVSWQARRAELKNDLSVVWQEEWFDIHITNHIDSRHKNACAYVVCWISRNKAKKQSRKELTENRKRVMKEK